jgi:PGAP1-like protein
MLPEPARSRRRKRRLWLAALVAMLTVSSSAIAAAPAHAAYGCGSATAENHADFQGWSWGTVWYCGNTGGTPMYAAANTNTQVAWMDSTWSWFVCWRHGAWHAGNNDVWYYSQGDRYVAGYSYRKQWGFMPAAKVSTTVDPHPEMPQCPADPPPAPARTDNLSKPVYFIHGYDPGAAGIAIPTAISDYWGAMINDFVTDGYPAYLSSSNVITFCYYTKLTGCTVNIGGTQQVPIKTIAKALAWDIYNRHSRYGRSVDLVSHSMGGLVAKAAITGVNKGESGFPPYLYVEDGVTISTPNAGVTYLSALACLTVSTPQCDDMRSSSGFMAWLSTAPASRIHTDWTFIGSVDDPVIDEDTAVPASMLVGHKVQYDSGQFIPTANAHMSILSRVSGSYHYIWCDLDVNRSTDPYCQNKSLFNHTTYGWDPSAMVRLSIYWKDYW